MALAVMDSSSRYGLVSRALHWGMALLFVWQFSSAVARVWLEDTAIEGFLWGAHSQVGVVLMALVVIRAVWAVMNASRRPPAVSVMAKLGHVALYGLMIVVPAIALIRQYGSGRALDVFGLSLMSGGGERIEWMTNLGGLLHGELGWALFALVVGHVVMAVLHRKLTNHSIMTRMA
ncbi:MULTISPECIES: cytochrome b [Halomonadaceae]|uniref:Cytochrome b n=1 Tax=Vreelandella piezotolerans TaxID=2609667 RepID=A0ABQ6X5U3_9GAMM|nr:MULTISPECIES: cytochrome b [Halomonas]KFC50952.1 cytochrome B561 [Halomonas sp. SUBG004]KAE8437372.1 cytochrome b [Halomonas piezotolerans]MCG7578231.1 cytochrome b [Halomonas sp. MMH1-48]MCG7605290.1 cytochrome b [Halomonas sp. MM17-34]MCG7614493.1 cytochrome b [Halomonas sp. MM17-29]|tara:strand:- start:586 stop:1113 length:528 start_codon:yes stop_codon:yes gene_type:complete